MILLPATPGQGIVNKALRLLQANLRSDRVQPSFKFCQGGNEVPATSLRRNDDATSHHWRSPPAASHRP